MEKNKTRQAVNKIFFIFLTVKRKITSWKIEKFDAVNLLKNPNFLQKKLKKKREICKSVDKMLKKCNFCLHGQVEVPTHQRLRSNFCQKTIFFVQMGSHARFHEFPKVSTNTGKTKPVGNTVYFSLFFDVILLSTDFRKWNFLGPKHNH